MSNKKRIILIILLVISFFIYGVFKNNKPDLLKDIWSNLDKYEKSQITDYRDGTIELIVIPNDIVNEITFIIDQNYLGNEVYLITFPTKNSPFLGDIKKLVDKDTGKIIGVNIRQ